MPYADGTKFNAAERWRQLELLQKHYAKFEDFLYDVMTEVLGYQCTDIQEDIGKFLAYGPKYKMVQAQRGQAKTTITAIYAAWCFIQDPTFRVVIISAGAARAIEIANWIIQIIMFMPELECLRPDESSRDRTSVSAFDIHHDLKGPEKSPSLACVGITSSIQGMRADLLVADDIESTKNSQTAKQRERLHHLTLDFISICSTGDVIYLGTPQNTDSVYNGLPSRGFTVRIWTGRYPTKEELPHYQGYIAPLILERIANDDTLQTGGGPTGVRGKPTDPIMLSEDVLTAKEIDQGAAYFQLQHMLDTKLMDEDRYPLKVGELVFMKFGTDRAPLIINWAPTEDSRILLPQGFPITDRMYKASGHEDEFGNFIGTHMYIDPSGGGQNGDELSYAITKFLAGKIFLVDVGGIPGGLGDKQLDWLTKIAVKYKVQTIDIEENFGKGALSKVWQPKLFREHKCHVEDVWESGQKELRIIDVLEPIIGSHRLIVDIDLIQKDFDTVQKYSAEKRMLYSLFFQMARITKDKGSLFHDDRLDAVAGSCRHWVQALALDENKAQAKAKMDNWRKMMSDPLGNGSTLPGWQKLRQTNFFDKFRRR